MIHGEDSSMQFNSVLRNVSHVLPFGELGEPK